MKFILAFILIILGGIVLSFLPLPWWGIGLLTFAIAFQMRLTAAISFFAAFLAVVLLWAGQAYFINAANDGVLLTKVSELLKLGGSMIWAIMLLIGGLVGGFSAMTGSFLRVVIFDDLNKANGRRRRR